jgi:hypoxanthine phosphoribosyltransferase
VQLSSEPLISEAAIAAKVVEMAAAITRDYASKTPVLVPVLKGGLFFAADLMRRLDFDLRVDFIRARSYAGHLSKGTVEFTFLPEQSLDGRHVLVLEDILDTGRTTSAVLDRLLAAGAASAELCALLDKPSRRVTPVTAKYIGFTIEDHFVVGYGLDCDECHRHLPAIYTLET